MMSTRIVLRCTFCEACCLKEVDKLQKWARASEHYACVNAGKFLLLAGRQASHLPRHWVCTSQPRETDKTHATEKGGGNEGKNQKRWNCKLQEQERINAESTEGTFRNMWGHQTEKKRVTERERRTDLKKRERERDSQGRSSLVPVSV